MRLGRTAASRPPVPFVDLVLIGNAIHSSLVLYPPGPDARLTHETNPGVVALAAGEVWDLQIGGRTLYQVVPGFPGSNPPISGYPGLLHLRLPSGALHSLHLFIPQGTPSEHQRQLAADFLRQSIAIARLIPELPTRMKRWNTRTIRVLCESTPLAAVMPLWTGPQEALSDCAGFSAYLAASVLQNAATTDFLHNRTEPGRSASRTPE